VPDHRVVVFGGPQNEEIELLAGNSKLKREAVDEPAALADRLRTSPTT
jgi:hypothetical protein